MTLSIGRPGGVSGTLGAFNFIRGVAFPSTAEVLSIFSTMVVLPAVIALPSAGFTLKSSLLFVVGAVILPGLAGELFNAAIVLRGDPVLDFRRLMSLELLSWWTLIILLPASTTVGLFFGTGGLWTDGFLAAVTLSLPLRFLTVFSMSSLSKLRGFVAASIIPAATIRSYLFLYPSLGVQSAEAVLTGPAVLVSGLVLSATGVLLLIRNVERSGSTKIGDSPMGLFRAFLQHWLKKERGPLEERLVSLGSTGQIDTSILAFSNLQKAAKGCVIVSNFHPGPYRDLGSGGLASILQSAVESSTGGIAMVPHGISNHEYNIISDDDIKELVHRTQMHYPSNSETWTASRMVREELGVAKASAQVFGETVLLTLTLAPQDMEDLPTEVLKEIREVATERGLRALAVDAHNSLSGQSSITLEQARDVSRAAIKALMSVTSLSQGPFRIGVASDPLKEFNLEDGIGPGGLSVIVVQSSGQLVGYVTIDGNNMQTGVRGMILQAILEAGIADGEVMTTDTHLVTGLVRSPLGYHPVGEGIDKQLLTRKVKQTIQRAIGNLEDASAGFTNFTLNLHVLGSGSFSAITSFISAIASKIGRWFLRLELASLILTLIMLTFL